jgi:hypothetical protein
MAASDQLVKLSARAKEAQDHVAAAQDKAKSDLEQQISDGRAVGQGQADRLRETAEAGRGNISDWWTDVQKSWDDHFEKIRKSIDERKAEHDADAAQRRAENAEDDALFAIDFAYSAIEEAEYAVLDAGLARLEADEVSGQSGATA